VTFKFRHCVTRQIVSPYYLTQTKTGEEINRKLHASAYTVGERERAIKMKGRYCLRTIIDQNEC